jgi:trans-aconitate methyltransferase
MWERFNLNTLRGHCRAWLQGRRETHRYANHNDRLTCVCGMERRDIPNRTWQVTDKEDDIIYPGFMYRCPICRSFSALNLYFPVEKYEGHSIDSMFIDEAKRRLNMRRLEWIMERVRLPPTPVLYDLGAGEGCFSHVFAETFPRALVVAVEGDAKVEAKFYGTLPNVTLVSSYIEPFLAEPPPGTPQADLMNLTDVLEHVLDPERTLALMQNRLADGGHAYITVPDAWTFQPPFPLHVASEQVDWRAANRTCQHLWMLTPDTLKTVIERALDIINVDGFETDIRRDSVYTTVLARRRL